MYVTYFVHGTTIDNERDLATGWAQGELSEKGRLQSIELGKAVGATRFDAVFTSDLKRAIDTAALAFGADQHVLQDPRLREIDYGKMTGCPAGQVKANLADFVAQPFPGGESYKDVEARISSYIGYLISEFFGKSVAIVSHQAPQLAFEVITRGKSWTEAFEQDWRRVKAWQPGWRYDIGA